MKRESKQMRELRAALRYWQGVYRLEARSLKKTAEKCREIAGKMRQEKRKNKA